MKQIHFIRIYGSPGSGKLDIIVAGLRDQRQPCSVVLADTYNSLEQLLAQCSNAVGTLVLVSNSVDVTSAAQKAAIANASIHTLITIMDGNALDRTEATK